MGVSVYMDELIVFVKYELGLVKMLKVVYFFEELLCSVVGKVFKLVVWDVIFGMRG